MVGNVWEWCRTVFWDCGEPAVEEPEGEASRVLRGGPFGDNIFNCRCAARFNFEPVIGGINAGFRLAAPL